MKRRTTILHPARRAAIVALGLLASACNDRGRSPLGEDLVQGGVLRGGLQVVEDTVFRQTADYAVFPASRGDADRLISAHEWPVAPGIESRPLLRFEVAPLDSLPEGTLFADAMLRVVYAPVPSEPVTVTVHRVTSPWSEDEATWDQRMFGVPWSTPGADFDPTPLATFTIQPAESDSAALLGDSLNVELPPELVADWISGAVENDGIALVQETPGTAVTFVSRGGGTNFNGPILKLDVLLPGEGNPSVELSALPTADTFVARDESALSGDGLLVAAGDPLERAFFDPSLTGLPAGATVAGARLVLTVKALNLPADSVRLIARQVLTEYRGEDTVVPRPTAGNAAGFVTVGDTIQPGDTLVFQSSLLTRLVRSWQRDPGQTRGIVVSEFDEGTNFGGILFYGPDAAADVRPRMRYLVVPSALPSGSQP